jgi:hypothetical protein
VTIWRVGSSDGKLWIIDAHFEATLVWQSNTDPRATRISKDVKKILIAGGRADRIIGDDNGARFEVWSD